MLEHKYGKESVAKARKSAELGMGFNLNAQTVANLSAELERDPQSLFPMDSEAIIKRISWSVDFSPMLSELGISTYEDLRLYRENLEKLGNFFGTVEQLKRRADDVTVSYYTIDVIWAASKEQFQNIPSIFASLQTSEQQLFKMGLARFLGLGCTEEVVVFRSVMEKMGLAKEIEALATRIEAERES